MIADGKNWIDEGVIVHPTAVIIGNVKIGKGSYIGPYAVIGDQAQIKNTETEKPIGKVTIGENTHIGPHCHISSGSVKNTVIGSNCYIMGRVHIGHDCVVGHNVILSEGAILSGHVEIENDVNCGIGSVFHQFAKIPEKCMVGMSAVVTLKAARQMKEKETWAGNPAKKLGKNKRWIK